MLLERSFWAFWAWIGSCIRCSLVVVAPPGWTWFQFVQILHAGFWTVSLLQTFVSMPLNLFLGDWGEIRFGTISSWSIICDTRESLVGSFRTILALETLKIDCLVRSRPDVTLSWRPRSLPSNWDWSVLRSSWPRNRFIPSSFSSVGSFWNIRFY